jgi:hypothetical protein
LLWLRQALTENLGLKAMALLFSLGFFGYIHGQEEVQQRTIPVSVISLPPEGGEKELVSRIPPSIHITVSGSTRALTEMVQQGVTPLELDLRQGYPLSVTFTRDMLVLPRNVELVLVDPPRLELEWEEVVTRQVPLQASITGQPAEGRVVRGEPRIEPERITVRGPASAVETLQFARLAPYVVTGLTEGTWARRIAISQPPGRIGIIGTPAATVTLEVVKRQTERLFPALAVQVVGPVRATVLPQIVDVTVTGPPEVVKALRPEQVVPRADLAALGKWTSDGPRHGSATVAVTIDLARVEAAMQPPSVTVRW